MEREGIGTRSGRVGVHLGERVAARSEEGGLFQGILNKADPPLSRVRKNLDALLNDGA